MIRDSFLNLLAAKINQKNHEWYMKLYLEDVDYHEDSGNILYKCNICKYSTFKLNDIYEHGDNHIKNSKLKCLI